MADDTRRQNWYSGGSDDIAELDNKFETPKREESYPIALKVGANPPPRAIEVEDHFVDSIKRNAQKVADAHKDDQYEYLYTVADHFRKEEAIKKEAEDEADQLGYGEIVGRKAVEVDGPNAIPPISPLYPFIRMDPTLARFANIAAYNRTHIPIADVEHRKSFRHIFISRPECYICCTEGGLSQQCANDLDFASAYAKLPYVLELLSPSYVTKQNFTSDSTHRLSNWNFLLSNRVTGMSAPDISLNVSENVGKAISGYSVFVPTDQTGYKGGTIDLTFRDTKYLDVGEMIRLWMLYIYKRHRGVFAPPYNGYQYTNSFVEGGSDVYKYGGDSRHLHPYDRAIEFPCTIFDILTDESDSRILHMSTYLGAYPVSLSRPYTNQANGPLVNMDISATFRYQAKIENNNSAMVLFNYNSHIVDSLGRMTGAHAHESVAWMVKQADENMAFVSNLLREYVGAASLFTGSPFIVVGQSLRNPIPGTNSGNQMMYTPYLKFEPVIVDEIRKTANAGFNVVKDQTDGTAVSLSQDTTDYDIHITPEVKEAAAALANYSAQVSATSTLNQELPKMKTEEKTKDPASGLIDRFIDHTVDNYNSAVDDVGNAIGSTIDQFTSLLS